MISSPTQRSVSFSPKSLPSGTQRMTTPRHAITMPSPGFTSPQMLISPLTNQGRYLPASVLPPPPSAPPPIQTVTFPNIKSTEVTPFFLSKPVAKRILIMNLGAVFVLYLLMNTIQQYLEPWLRPQQTAAIIVSIMVMLFLNAWTALKAWRAPITSTPFTASTVLETPKLQKKKHSVATPLSRSASTVAASPFRSAVSSPPSRRQTNGNISPFVSPLLRKSWAAATTTSPTTAAAITSSVSSATTPRIDLPSIQQYKPATLTNPPSEKNTNSNALPASVHPIRLSPEQTLTQLDLTHAQMEQWCMRFKQWTAKHVLAPLHTLLQQSDQTSLERYWHPSFQFAEGMNPQSLRQYMQSRLLQLSRYAEDESLALADYRWSSGAQNQWQPGLPTDSQLMMHVLFCWWDLMLSKQPQDMIFTNQRLFPSGWQLATSFKLVSRDQWQVVAVDGTIYDAPMNRWQV